MTPEQALALLNQITAGTALNRQDHMAAVQAVEVLNQLIQSAAQEGNNALLAQKQTAPDREP